MEEFIKSDLEFEDDELNYFVNSLRTCFICNQRDFCHLCFVIYRIWDYCKNNYWKAKNNEYYNSYKLLEKFGFDKKAVSRYKSCYVRFMYPPDVQGYACSLMEIFKGFSPSKLFELLSLSQEAVEEAVANQLIKPTMTIKQIREYIKTLKEGSDKAEKVIEDTTINEDDIPMAYDPKQEYEYTYFETKTKNQLLNIVWELQKAYQKLKSNKEKNKNA